MISVVFLKIFGSMVYKKIIERRCLQCLEDVVVFRAILALVKVIDGIGPRVEVSVYEMSVSGLDNRKRTPGLRPLRKMCMV